jgi:uncharacterized phiE125 gp8 family phage protein
MYGLRRTVNPTIDPVTLTEAKLHLRVDGDDEDTLIEGIITAAVDFFEKRTGRALISQTWRYTIDDWSANWEHINPGWFYLPKAPLASVTSIYYTATDGSSTLWDAANYTVDTNSEPGRLALAYGKTWPVTRKVVNAIVITYVAGYGATAADVPVGIKRALMVLISDLYNNRGTIEETGGKESMPLDRIIAPWMVGDSYYSFVGME